MSTIGSRIRNRRKELGLSQDELGKRLGYKSRASINKIELGQRNLTQSKIKAIADALETTPSYIMGWDENNARLEGDIPTIGSGCYESEEQREIARLKRELRDTRDALDVLKKAIGILGKD